MVPLKVELHSHTADDPADRIPHSSIELIDRAADLGYDALAITLHDRQLDLAPLRAHADARKLVLIPGIERTIEGRHILLLNFTEQSMSVRTFEDLRDLKRRERGLVVAPHPFFLVPGCVGNLLNRHEELFDAVEVNAMHVRGVNFNRRAERWAAAHRKPLVGNGDVHRLAQLGSTYSLVDSERDASSICEAIRAGRVEVRSSPLSWLSAAAIASDILVTMLRG